MGLCFLDGSIDCDPGYPAEQRVIEYSEADYGASAAAVEESVAATAVQKVSLKKEIYRMESTTDHIRIHENLLIKHEVCIKKWI